MKRRDFLKRVGVAALAATPLAGCRLNPLGDSPSGPPNIVLIVTDDQRWDAMSWMGNPIIQTPHQDRLANEGVAFTNSFTTSAICCISRASILTGQWQLRHGIKGFGTPIPKENWPTTYPALLRNAGYRVGFVGKWGMGGEIPKDEFDFWEGRQHLGPYVPKKKGDPHWTEVVEGHALDFVDGCDAEQPFCLQLSFQAPHAPFHSNPKYLEQYDDIEIPMPETATDEAFEAQPDFVKNSEGRKRWKKRFKTPAMSQRTLKNYYGLINGVDDAVGALMAKLDKKGLADNTVIIYTSDNGFFFGEHGMAGKWLMYEESIRVPLMIHDPRRPKRESGRRVEEMVLNVDLAPTILDYAGIAPPETMQGRSLRPLLSEETRPTDWRQEWFYEHLIPHPNIPRTEGVRTGRWSYTRYVGTEPMHELLYDLDNDPLQRHNLATETRYATNLAEMRERWKALREKAK